MRKKDVFGKSLFVAIVCLLATVYADIGKAGNPSTLTTSPTRITFDANNNLLVADYFYGQVLTVSPHSLEILDEININGRPLSVAWANEHIYVGNVTLAQVEVLNAVGQVQFLLGHGAYPVKSPRDITIGEDRIYVVDGAAKVVKIFGLDGTFLSTIPEKGYERGVLANPTAIAVDMTTEQVFVSDYGDLGTRKTISPRIQVFDLKGSLLYTISSGKSNNFLFTMPQGLTINDENQLYVTDSLTGKIHIFDTNDGMLLGTVKGSGSKAGIFNMKMPLDLVIDDATNDLFVTNNLIGNIKVFKGAGGIK